MGWGGSKKVTVPDTRDQEAEMQRQFDALIAQMQAFMDAQVQIAGDEREADRVRYEGQRAADLAEAERQRSILLQQLTDQKASQAEINAKLDAQRAAQEAAAAQRATDARAYSDGRIDLVDQVSGAIDTAYSGFDDSYFGNFMQQIMAAARPTIDKQYKDDRRSARLALTDAGNLNSSAGARALADLSRGYKERLGSESAKASDLATSLRTQIDAQKRSALSTLINSAFIGADDLPEGADVQNTLDDVASRLSNYVKSVTESVRQYTPMAGSSSLVAPTITAPQVKTNLPAPTANTGPQKTDNMTQAAV